MGNPKRGLYGKFLIERTDGKSAPGQKHDGCSYFVLDVTHDPFAIPALRAYAAACDSEYPLLACDIDTILNSPSRVMAEIIEESEIPDDDPTKEIPHARD